jgi:hypothetical protein
MLLCVLYGGFWCRLEMPLFTGPVGDIDSITNTTYLPNTSWSMEQI